jgi:hypothetical protein
MEASRRRRLREPPAGSGQHSVSGRRRLAARAEAISTPEVTWRLGQRNPQSTMILRSHYHNFSLVSQ